MQQNSSNVKKEKYFGWFGIPSFHTEATMQHSICKDLYNRSQQDNCRGDSFSVLVIQTRKLQHVNVSSNKAAAAAHKPLGFSQCKVVQAKLPNPSAILLNHSMAEHSPMCS